ncbi:hypothetical protein CAter282_1681 [Collimonas arenae]|uniref:Uncharacterized protein n=1 Tax=Collimonas arenae TaxID=279058 RepID=A0A127QIN2_9BURK|nr:hypothetical protein CAter10_1812 [Collimonas arenae]AMP09462.1 hypothetical protein CAter282_1681 [Collimonas arenae]
MQVGTMKLLIVYAQQFCDPITRMRCGYEIAHRSDKIIDKI